MNNSFFRRFAPKEVKFFPLLSDLAEVSNKSAEKLVACIENNSPLILQSIKDLEHDGDRIIAKIYDELNATFITPFDREDINALANRLDDVTDQIYGCAKRITFYRPKSLPMTANQIADMTNEATKFMLEAVNGLSNIKSQSHKIQKICDRLHDIESDADEVFQNFTIELFEKNTDAIEVIKLKEIMNVLEGITDEIDHVGKIIKTIIVKYA